MLVFVYYSDAEDLTIALSIAKKEDEPEEALKDFKAIVDQEEEQGDWYVGISTPLCSLLICE
jgi:hypothetical protein